MKIWSVRRYEMESCCGMQIDSLLELLKKCKQNNITTGISVKPECMAAPENDSLFDCLRLFAKSTENDAIEISGTVYYCYPDNTEESATIRTFKSLDDCIAWLSSKNSAEECAEKLMHK